MDLEGNRGIQGELWDWSRGVLSPCACTAMLCCALRPHGQLPHHGISQPKPRDSATHTAATSSRKHGTARPHQLEEWEGWGTLPSLSAGTDCEQLWADKE